MQTQQLALDDISGTSILEDGTQVHWTEGRSSWVVVEYPDGTAESAPVCARPDARVEWLRGYQRAGAVLERLETQDETGYDEYRDMTAEEAAHWSQARDQYIK